MMDAGTFASSLRELIFHLEADNREQAEYAVQDEIVFLNGLLDPKRDASKFGTRSEPTPLVAADSFGCQQVSDTLAKICRVRARLVDGNLAAARAASRTALEKWEQSPGSS